MEYNFRDIEPKWRRFWAANKTFKAEIDCNRPKYYVLDMFPYPSGAGLHVGHPLGYIASDIIARYRRQKGYNVLHPMGYDAFGLPAEQYAIQTGQHPAITTEQNIARYRDQLDKLGFSFDWDREIRTSDPEYYKWTQWTFLKLFGSWYNKLADKAEPIDSLIREFECKGNASVSSACGDVTVFSATEWNNMSEQRQQDVLMQYRLAYLADTVVNWCPALGTVLANDEVSEGLSIRGGHPVERKLMKQWSLRITAYADRLIDGFERIDWPENVKEMQRNWIGRSEGAMIKFPLKNYPNKFLEVFTTRPDTIFGVTFMSIAPEHEFVDLLTVEDQKQYVDDYVSKAKNRSERERMADAKNISGEFTGSYAINPFNGEEIPIWVADYVLAGYGTGAVMAVPAHDSRDYAFAQFFGLPIREVISGGNIDIEAFESKEGVCVNSEFINGMIAREAIHAVIQKAEELGIGKGKINYRLRDAIFSRQRYWGEPFPIYYRDGIACPMKEEELPLLLPEVDKYLPTESGEPPLARAKNWKTIEGFPFETSTMPGFAGSSAYYFRYMDPTNADTCFSKEAVNYWRSVDFYVGGAEHATGHLMYARFWNKFLFDIGLCPEDEPFKKMINQGMIQGRSSFVYRVKPEVMAEFVLWEMIKDKQLGASFIREFKEDQRTFDFFCEDAGIIIEIKKQSSLEKVAVAYENWANSNGYRVLLFSIVDVILNTEAVLDRIKQALKGIEVPVLSVIDEWEDFPVFVSKNIKGRESFSYPIHVDIDLVDNDLLDTKAFCNWRPEYEQARFILEDNKYICGWEVEKMSKSKYNVQNPDDLVDRYGADTLRMYEMFLGPVEQSKPWDTKGIEGVFRFLRKFWRLFFDDERGWLVNNEEASADELRVLNKTIKKIEEDIERFSLNTAVSTFMICCNELSELKCHKRAVLEPLVILISSFAPHIAEELWENLGHKESITYAGFPEWDEKHLTISSISYPVSFNGKMRFTLDLPAELSVQEIEKLVLEHELTKKWLDGKIHKKIIIVPGRIVNIVI